MTASEIIDLLQLKPLPLEGGYYRETYRAAQRIPGGKSAGTAIYYLLTPDTCSLLHRLPTDEIYHFYLGDPVELLLLGKSGEIVTLGSDLLAGQRSQFVVEAGCWQGSVLREGGAFALMGTTMAPGFDFSDYEAGERTVLLASYPDFAERICRLSVAATSPGNSSCAI